LVAYKKYLDNGMALIATLIAPALKIGAALATLYLAGIVTYFGVAAGTAAMISSITSAVLTIASIAWTISVVIGVFKKLMFYNNRILAGLNYPIKLPVPANAPGALGAVLAAAGLAGQTVTVRFGIAGTTAYPKVVFRYLTFQLHIYQTLTDVTAMVVASKALQ